METQLSIASSAIALAAMVLIWNEAPIAESPSDRLVDHRVAYSDGVEQPGSDRIDRARVERHSTTRSARQGERAVKGGRTGAGPAARPATPGDERGTESESLRTGVGPKAEPASPDGGAGNVAH